MAQERIIIKQTTEGVTITKSRAELRPLVVWLRRDLLEVKGMASS